MPSSPSSTASELPPPDAQGLAHIDIISDSEADSDDGFSSPPPPKVEENAPIKAPAGMPENQLVDTYERSMNACSKRCLYCMRMGRPDWHVADRCDYKSDWISAKTSLSRRTGGLWLAQYAVCYKCVQPQFVCQAGTNGSMCRLRDMVLPYLYGIFEEKNGPTWVHERFGRRFEQMLDFLKWTGQKIHMDGKECVVGTMVIAVAFEERRLRKLAGKSGNSVQSTQSSQVDLTSSPATTRTTRGSAANTPNRPGVGSSPAVSRSISGTVSSTPRQPAIPSSPAASRSMRASAMHRPRHHLSMATSSPNSHSAQSGIRSSAMSSRPSAAELEDKLLNRYERGFEAFKGQCLYCLVLGKSPDHEAITCGKSGVWGGAKRDAKRLRHVLIPSHHGCFDCWQPKTMCNLFVTKEVRECTHGDMLLSLLLGIFHIEGGVEWINHTFNINLVPGDAGAYIVWAADPKPIAGIQCMRTVEIAAKAFKKFLGFK